MIHWFQKYSPKVVWSAFVLGLCAIALAAWFGASNQNEVTIPQEFTAKREEAVQLLEKLNAAFPVSMAPLAALEAEKKYREAANLIGEALLVNAVRLRISADLAKAGEELSALSLRIRPEAIGGQAVEVFGVLSRLAAAMTRYHDSQKKVYEISKQYYESAASSGTLPAPPAEIQNLATAVDTNLGEAKALLAEFERVLIVFDTAIKDSQ